MRYDILCSVSAEHVADAVKATRSRLQTLINE